MEGRAGRLGHHARPDRGAAGQRADDHLHTGVHRRCAAQHRRLSPGAGRHERHGGGAGRDRGLRVGPPRAGRHLRRSPVIARAHPAQQPDRDGVDAGPVARPGHAGQPGPAAAAAEAGRVRPRPVLPAGRPDTARDQAQRPAGLAVVLGLERRAAARCRRAAPLAGRQAVGRHRHHRPPVGRGAAVRGGPAPVEGHHLDAQAERHHRPAGARLHGRGHGLRPADRGAADQEADHDADEAGARLRRGDGAGDAEPGRHRLQGHLQRRDVDGRAAADRAGQGTAARRDECGRRRGRRADGRRDHRWAGQAGVRAAPSRSAGACRPDLALGHELPAGAVDPRPDREPDGITARGRGGSRCAGSCCGRSCWRRALSRPVLSRPVLLRRLRRPQPSPASLHRERPTTPLR